MINLLNEFPIDPATTSGSDLALILDRLFGAVSTTNANGTRPWNITTPPGAPAGGGLWVDNSTPGTLILNFFDGTKDHPIGSVKAGNAVWGDSVQLAQEWKSNTAYTKGQHVWNPANGPFGVTPGYYYAISDLTATAATTPDSTKWSLDPNVLQSVNIQPHHAVNDADNMFTAKQTFKAGVEVQGTVKNNVVTANDGNFDLTKGVDFDCTMAAGVTLSFTAGKAAGIRGMIRLVNQFGSTVTFGANILKGAQAAADLSKTGTYLLSYMCPNGSDILLTYSEALS